MKEFFEYIGLEGEDLDALKEKFNETYIAKDKALNDEGIKSKMYATVMHGVDKLIGDHFGDLVDVSELAKQEKTRDKIAFLNDTIKGKIEELKASSTPKTDEKIKAEISSLKEQLKIKEEGLAQQAAKLQEVESTYEAKLSGIVFEQKKQIEVIDQLKFAEAKDEFWRRGFFASMESKYNLVLEEGQLKIRTKDGKIIPSATRAGAEKSPLEVYNEELKELGGVKIVGGKQTTERVITAPQSKIKINPRALA
jgi:hypothetical protein